MNIIFTHCSALIIIADYKLNMSRSSGSYNADWQRRKSVLIRSLFHDIPNPEYKQITTTVMVHFDGSQDAGARDSRVSEDSVKSVILPTRFRRVVASRNLEDRIEVLPILEDNADPKTVPVFYTDTESENTEEYFQEVATPQPGAKEEGIIEMKTPQADALEQDVEEMSNPRLNTAEEDDDDMSTPPPEGDVEGIESLQPETTEENVEEMGIPDPIEQMRSPRPDLFCRTIPLTHRSHSESTSERTADPQELTALTSSTQDGADHNTSEIQTSNEMNEILTSIFNESRNKNGTPISGRKRKLVNKSVQVDPTSRVTWEEMRANFFVGTPKIFRLCSCADHICN